MRATRFILGLLVLLGLLMPGGCKTLELDSLSKPAWMGGGKPTYQTPSRLAVIWADAMLNVPDAPTRGFGGRIYFYNHKNEAIPVDGQLIVYAYDDSAGVRQGRQPDRKYVFTAEQLTEYFDETQLGASYTVWLPWDRATKERQDVSLVPIFTADNGARVVGQHTQVTLPGEEGDPITAQRVPIQHSSRTLHDPVRQVAHLEPEPAPPAAESAPPSEPSVRTTTIQVSPATARRLQTSEAAQGRLQQSAAPSGSRGVDWPASTGYGQRPAQAPGSNGWGTNQAPGNFGPATNGPSTNAPATNGPATNGPGSPNWNANGGYPYGGNPAGPAANGAYQNGPNRAGLTAYGQAPASGPGAVNTSWGNPTGTPSVDRNSSGGGYDAATGATDPLAGQRSAHFGPRRFPAQAQPIDRLDPDRFQRPRSLAGRPFGLPSSPVPATSVGYPAGY
jgi:hypothetical protein